MSRRAEGLEWRSLRAGHPVGVWWLWDGDMSYVDPHVDPDRDLLTREMTSMTARAVDRFVSCCDPHRKFYVVCPLHGRALK